MILRIKNVLTNRAVRQAQSLLDGAIFVDGSLSAGSLAAGVKHNQELSLQSPLHQQLNQLVMSSLVNHSEYQAAVLPLKVATAFYSRYQQGMRYGAHVDDAVMGPITGRYRSDVSTTIFLNSPDDYDGGELLIHTQYGEELVKLEAGDAVIYPSGSLHEVKAVTAGERLVAVTWAQSMVKATEQREMLFNISQIRESLTSQNDAEKARLDQVYSNLLRMWSEI